jgi:hypothetical protein
MMVVIRTDAHRRGDQKPIELHDQRQLTGSAKEVGGTLPWSNDAPCPLHLLEPHCSKMAEGMGTCGVARNIIPGRDFISRRTRVKTESPIKRLATEHCYDVRGTEPRRGRPKRESLLPWAVVCPDARSSGATYGDGVTVPEYPGHRGLPLLPCPRFRSRGEVDRSGAPAAGPARPAHLRLSADGGVASSVRRRGKGAAR